MISAPQYFSIYTSTTNHNPWGSTIPILMFCHPLIQTLSSIEWSINFKKITFSLDTTTKRTKAQEVCQKVVHCQKATWWYHVPFNAGQIELFSMYLRLLIGWSIPGYYIFWLSYKLCGVSWGILLMWGTVSSTPFTRYRVEVAEEVVEVAEGAGPPKMQDFEEKGLWHSNVRHGYGRQCVIVYCDTCRRVAKLK